MAIELKEKSKSDFTTEKNDLEFIQTGCLQRMANSLERIEKPYLDLINRVQYYTRRNLEQLEEIENLKKSISTYKGHFNRLKRKELKMKTEKEASNV